MVAVEQWYDRKNKKNSNTRITKTKRNMTYFVGKHMKKKGTK